MTNRFQKSHPGAGCARPLACIQKIFGLFVIVAFAAFGLFATVLEAFLW